MKIYDKLYSQLNHLVSTIPNCNFLSWEDKKDIVQDSILALYKKIEEGVLVDNFDEIKGYSFLTLRNFCYAYHKTEVKRETPVSEFWEIHDTSTTSEDEEYAQYLHRIVKSYLQQTKYSEMDKRVGELLLEDLEDKEIENETGLTRLEIRKHKFRIKNKLKFDYRRPVKFFVRNLFNKNIKVPCFTIADAKNYLSHIPPRQVTYMITHSFVTKDGFYMDIIIQKKRKRKKNE